MGDKKSDTIIHIDTMSFKMWVDLDMFIECQTLANNKRFFRDVLRAYAWDDEIIDYLKTAASIQEEAHIKNNTRLEKKCASIVEYVRLHWDGPGIDD